MIEQVRNRPPLLARRHRYVTGDFVARFYRGGPGGGSAVGIAFFRRDKHNPHSLESCTDGTRVILSGVPTKLFER